MLTRVVNIGIWNMQVSESVNVAHGLTYNKIRSVFASIVSDTGDTWYPLEHSAGYTDIDGKLIWNAVNIVLFVRVGGYFDNILFNDAVMNRGYVTIGYVQ